MAVCCGVACLFLLAVVVGGLLVWLLFWGTFGVVILVLFVCFSMFVGLLLYCIG